MLVIRSSAPSGRSHRSRAPIPSRPAHRALRPSSVDCRPHDHDRPAVEPVDTDPPKHRIRLIAGPDDLDERWLCRRPRPQREPVGSRRVFVNRYQSQSWRAHLHRAAPSKHDRDSAGGVLCGGACEPQHHGGPVAVGPRRYEPETTCEEALAWRLGWLKAPGLGRTASEVVNTSAYSPLPRPPRPGLRYKTSAAETVVRQPRQAPASSGVLTASALGYRLGTRPIGLVRGAVTEED